MADQVLKIIYYIFYGVELFLVRDGIFHNKVKEKKKYFTMAGIYLPIMAPAVLLVDNPFFIIMALNLIMFVALFEGSAASHILHFGGVYLLTNMAETMIFGVWVTLLQPASNNLELSFAGSGEVSLFFAAAITGIILYIVTRKSFQNFVFYFRALNWLQYLVIFMIVWSGILLLGIITVLQNYIENKKTGEMLFVLTILFMTMAFIGVGFLVFNVYYKDYYLKQNQIKEEIIHIQQMYFQNIYDNDNEMRKFRHDISSQLNCLKELLKEGKTNYAIEHLQEIGSHFSELEMVKFHTGNEILDVIINQKAQEAEKKGIRIEVEGKIDRPDFMDTYDLCMLFSNILDNSIEACEIMGTEKNVIKIFILMHRNTVFFQFINPATPAMYEALKKKSTLKEDRINHGFGIENIQRAIRKNKGEIEYFYKDGKLILEIYFEAE